MRSTHHAINRRRHARRPTDQARDSEARLHTMHSPKINAPASNARAGRGNAVATSLQGSQPPDSSVETFADQFLPHSFPTWMTPIQCKRAFSTEETKQEKQQHHCHTSNPVHTPQPYLLFRHRLLQAAIRAETARFARCSHAEKGAGGKRRPLAARRSR